MPWNPEQYHKFQSERFALYYALLALVKVHAVLKMIDPGCGTGELRRGLADRLPGSCVTRLDSSPQMLVKAASAGCPAAGKPCVLSLLQDPIPGQESEVTRGRT